jgi:hypothetical protein
MPLRTICSGASGSDVLGQQAVEQKVAALCPSLSTAARRSRPSCTKPTRSATRRDGRLSGSVKSLTRANPALSNAQRHTRHSARVATPWPRAMPRSSSTPRDPVPPRGRRGRRSRGPAGRLALRWRMRTRNRSRAEIPGSRSTARPGRRSSRRAGRSSAGCSARTRWRSRPSRHGPPGTEAVRANDECEVRRSQLTLVRAVHPVATPPRGGRAYDRHRHRSSLTSIRAKHPVDG